MRSCSARNQHRRDRNARAANGTSPLALLLLVMAEFASAAAAAGQDVPPTSARDAAPATPAPTLPTHLSLTISGDPASSDFIVAQIHAAVERAARAAGIAPPLVQAILPQPQILPSGFFTGYSIETRTTLSVDGGPNPRPIIAASEAANDRDVGAAGAVTRIDVVNAGLPPFSPDLLSFKDDPERITADGVLSRTVVDAGRPARLYYYHENIAQHRRFCVVLSANDSVMTHVQIVGAAAGPNVDVMSVGHAVSKNFLAVEPRNEGTVIDVAGGQPVVERDTPIAPGDGIVGALDLRVLDGGPLTVTVLAVPVDSDPLAYLYAAKLADDGHARHGTFDLNDFGRRIIAYTVGGPTATYTYGSRAQTPRSADVTDIAPRPSARTAPTAAPTGHDYGDYGVLQRITFDLANPADDPATVYLYEKPLGGDVRSSFAVNGNIIDVGCVRVAQPYGVTSIALAPHATSALDVLTMTDGGSNYPLEIGVTTSRPLLQTPPITAPDGCFPKRKPAPQPGSGAAGR
jgi:hypothetical protein